MDILVYLFFLLSIAVRNITGFPYCEPTILANCPDNNSSANIIYVDNHFSRGKCSSITIGNQTYIYDTVNITKVWITLKNENKVCDINTMIQMNKVLDLKSEMVIFIQLTGEFFRMIYVNMNGSRFNVVNFPIGFEKKLADSNFSLYYAANNPDTFGKVCFNGGNINDNYTGAGYRCTCPKWSISFGPRCEYMDRVLNTSIYYYNIFPDDKYIQLTFSLFSNGVKNIQSLLTIKNSTFKKIVEVKINESQIYLETNDNRTQIKFSIDRQTWHNFYLTVTPQNVSLQLAYHNMILNFTSEITETFKTHYLILKEDNLKDFSFCIRNIKSNTQIIDLNNGDGYESCCLDRCKCSKDEYCDCYPFISNDNKNCYCKIGFNKVNDKCEQSAAKYSETADAQEVTYPLQDAPLNRMDFKFRTLSTEGTLTTQNSSNALILVTTKIVKTNLMLTVSNKDSRQILFNVSDGQFHSVTLNIKNESLEMILDDNPNYTVFMLNWGPGLSNLKFSSITLGPLYKPFNSSVNTFTTCFSDIRFNGIGDNPIDVNLTVNSNIKPQCSNNLLCSNLILNCSLNEECNDKEWQFTKCICKANFTSYESKCTYFKCLKNPCQNGGLCVYDATKNNYMCLCKEGYTGNDCENAPLVASLWWIAILVVLLLLLIVLIVILVYCCCYKKSHAPKSPYIKEIHENTVVYNDQAGECDYNGPPINYDIMKKALGNTNLGYTSSVPVNPAPDLMNKKLDLDRHNKDLILDHPLEYGYEGDNSDNESVSSLGSNSTNSQLNTMPLDNTNKHFNYLNELYK